MTEKDHKHPKGDDKYETLIEKGMNKESGAKKFNFSAVSERDGEHSRQEKSSLIFFH
ncbi:MAG: hypothetical protein ABI325_01900 [Ginsengibacter sp.]